LLDAMVFFAIALLVSSMLVSQARQETRPGSTGGEEAYVDSVLLAFLGASVGSSVRLMLEEPVEIESCEKIGDCLMAELHSLRDGHSTEDFEPLNAILTAVLVSIVEKPFLFSLSAYEVSGSGATLMIQLQNTEDPTGETAYASSTNVVDDDGALFVIVLQLRPAALPEVDRV